MENAVAKEKIRFPKVFWIANGVELLERAAYYGFFIAITLYLTRVVGYDDIWAGWIGGIFGAGLYFLPAFTGAYADKIGFRKALILAFSLLAMGYFTLGALPDKFIVIPALFLVMVGGSFIKAIITGTVAKSSNEETRAKAYSVFYLVVNIGAFLGKTFAYPLRLQLGVQSINFYSAAMCAIAVFVAFFFFRGLKGEGEGKTIKEVWDGFFRVVSNVRLLVLILIVTGFWMIQQQLYATMPKYVLRMVGEGAAPEWLANVNPAVVMISVYFVTHIMSKVRAVTSMTFGMFIMPISALSMAASPILEKITGDSIDFGLFTMHPITVAMIVGIIFQGLAECFISPRFLEYFSKQAPKGEEGLYMGFSHLHSFISHILAFGISGYLLTAYCPDPKTLTHLTEAEKALRYANAHMIWYYFAAIGLISGIALIIYDVVTKRIDRKRAEAA